MKTFPCILVPLMTVFICTSALRAADDLPSAEKTKGNAALIYWVAFDECDSLTRDEAIAKAVGDHSTAAIDAKLRKALKESQALTLLRMASRIEHCDWGTALMLHEQGPMTLMPHLKHTRQLARLGLLSARIHLLDKKPDEALADLLAVYRLARHSQSGEVLITMLVGIATDSMVNQFIADNLALFDDATLRAFLDEHAKLPAMMHVRVAIVGERDGFGGWIKRQVARLKDKNTLQRLMATLAGNEDGIILRQFAGKSPEQAAAIVDEMLEMYQPLVKMIDLPAEPFRKAYDLWSKEIETSKNPLAKLLMPAFGSSYAVYHGNLAMTALLRAAITFKLDGKAAFDAIKDPYGDGQFTMTVLQEGWEVSSKFIGRDQKPVKLVVK